MTFFRTALASTLSLSITASASTALATPAFDAEYSPKDWGYSLLSGIGGGVAGGMLGGLLGFGLAGPSDCKESDGSLCPIGMVPVAAISTTVFGGLGLTFGSAGGVYAYGELSGHSGNYWAALGGSATGLVGAFGLYALVNEIDSDAASVTLFASSLILPAVFSTWFYAMSLDSGEQRIPTGGLIDVDGGVVRLGVPEVGVAFGAEGVERVDVKVLGARF